MNLLSVIVFAMFLLAGIIEIYMGVTTMRMKQITYYPGYKLQMLYNMVIGKTKIVKGNQAIIMGKVHIIFGILSMVVAFYALYLGNILSLYE